MPAFRKRFPDALPAGRHEDYGRRHASEARSVYSGGGNIFDFLLSLAWIRRNRSAACAMSSGAAPNCCDLFFPTSCRVCGLAAVGEVASMVEACRRDRYPPAVRRAGTQTRNSSRTTISAMWFARSSNGSASPPSCRWSAGLGHRTGKESRQGGVCAKLVISGNMGLLDGNGYNLPPAEIQRLVAGFIAEVSGCNCSTSPDVRRADRPGNGRPPSLSATCWDAAVANARWNTSSGRNSRREDAPPHQPLNEGGRADRARRPGIGICSRRTQPVYAELVTGLRDLEHLRTNIRRFQRVDESGQSSDRYRFFVVDSGVFDSSAYGTANIAGTPRVVTCCHSAAVSL